MMAMESTTFPLKSKNWIIDGIVFILPGAAITVSFHLTESWVGGMFLFGWSMGSGSNGDRPRVILEHGKVMETPKEESPRVPEKFLVPDFQLIAGAWVRELRTPLSHPE